MPNREFLSIENGDISFGSVRCSRLNAGHANTKYSLNYRQVLRVFVIETENTIRLNSVSLVCDSQTLNVKANAVERPFSQNNSNSSGICIWGGYYYE
jgi:hypothetical protein